MKRSPLQRLIEHARRQRDDAAAQAASAQHEVAQAQKTLDMLSSYLHEHLGRVRTQAHTDSPLLRIREGFTRKLDVAIDEQTRQRDGLRDNAEREHAELLERQRRLLAFEAVQARRESIRRLRLHRADQRHTDEIAAQLLQRHRRKSADES
ncbi:MAG: flagellar export protein FliJ [Burkholderiaceae bacterium]|nr:flagellar export protein FliJ [Burkholderiaceae bacterium]